MKKHDKENGTVEADAAKQPDAALAEKDILIGEQKKQILRLMADFDNFKKRAEKEREDIICFSNEVLIVSLLPILDNFDRAMKHVDASRVEGEEDELLKGFALIKKQMEDLLSKAGVTAIDAVGKKFDPFYHEAILTKESPMDEGTVIEEMQKGYLLRDKVIRPSMVIVAKK